MAPGAGSVWGVWGVDFSGVSHACCGIIMAS